MNAPTPTQGNAVLHCKSCTAEFTRTRRGGRTQVHCEACSGRLKNNPRQWAIELRRRVVKLEAEVERLKAR